VRTEGLLATFRNVGCSLVFGIVSLGFGALIVWEISLGAAGGRYGGVSAAEAPGAFSFFIAMQSFMGLVSMRSALQCAAAALRYEPNLIRSDKGSAYIQLLGSLFFLLLCILGVWATWDIALILFGTISTRESIQDRIITAILAITVLGVLISLLTYLWIIPTVTERLPAIERALQTMRGQK